MFSVDNFYQNLTLKKMLLGISYLHDLLGIFRSYEVMLTRPIRFAVAYVSVILMLALSAIFS